MLLKNNEKSHIYIDEIIDISLPGHRLQILYAESLQCSEVELVHNHKFYEIYYSIDCAIRIKVGEHYIILNPKNMLLIGSGVEHGVVYDPQNTGDYFVVAFSLEKSVETNPSDDQAEVYEITQLASVFKANEFWSGKDNQGIHETIETLNQELRLHLIGWRTKTNRLYFDLITACARNMKRSQIEYPNERNVNRNTALQIVKFLQSHYTNDISLADAAMEFAMTPRHVNRVFKNYFGTTYYQTLIFFRLNYAKKYLCSTDFSIEKIAECVGFGSVQSFNKLLKEIEGISIYEYRKQNYPCG